MEDNQLIARTRHLAVANLLLGTPTSGSSASSVPASPRSVLVGSAARPTRGGSSDGSSGGDDDDNDDDAVVGDALDEDHEDGGGGQGGGAIGGLQRDRSTAVAGIMAAGARPLEGLVDQESEACDAAAVWCPSPSASASASACLSWPSPLSPAALSCRGGAPLEGLPVEVLFHIMGFLDVNDLLSVSRTNHQLRSVSLTPLLHAYRLQRTRVLLPPMLWSPSRPSLADLIARSIFLTHTTVVSRRLARSLVSIRLARRLAARPSPETLAERAVLPRECLPPGTDDDEHGREERIGFKRRGTMRTTMVSPALVQQKRRVERERIKDGLRRWVGAQWRRAVREKGESVRLREESCGVGRVWRLTRFWERVIRGEGIVG